MTPAVAADALGETGYTFADLHDPDRLASLYERFCEETQALDPTCWNEWNDYRHHPETSCSAVARSELLVAMAAHVSRFISRLFPVRREADAVAQTTAAQDDLFRFKVDFVRRRALPLLKDAAPATPAPDADPLVKRFTRGAGDLELAIARAGCALMDRERAGKASNASGPEAARELAAVNGDIEALKRWCALRIHDPVYRDWVMFRFPEAVNYFSLVPVEHPRPDLPEAMEGPDQRLRRRDGFALTDPRMKPKEVLSEIHYCVICHERDKDSCSKGIHARDGRVSVNPLGIELHGCPLDEKISEMHARRKAGDPIGALALVMVDNPMCPGTGHRICNDCMKACIYQKQDPVNVPQIETGVLTDVLALPWGVEIYGLLTRWNPLNVRRPYALPHNGKRVLVVGLGPAGYTLAHYLVNEGFGVVGIDGLKIEPLPADLVGTDATPPRPIRDWTEIYRQLDDRVLEGFGGVSEYGITVRWDKNFLTLLHLTLARRHGLRMYGGVRFGGTVLLDDAWAYGFDHVAIAAGAGRPTIIDMKNNLIQGIRKASDFLMALQLTGAFKREALPNLQTRLPAVVIGGGLTAIDAATELMAYYPLLVEKTLHRYEALSADAGETRVRAAYDLDELVVLDEYLAHGRAVAAERARADGSGERPDFISLVRSWGGVTIAYRKALVDSPAYRLNHEEVIKAFEEGIVFAEHLTPVEAVPDASGAVESIIFARGRQGGQVTLPARTVLVAAGTTPNVTCERERHGTFELDTNRQFFQPYCAVEEGDGRFHLESDSDGFFTSYERDGRFVTYYGDNHPRYAGNVVKAMASAREGYPHIVQLFDRELRALDPARQADRDRAWTNVLDRLDSDFTAHVQEVIRLTPTIVEVVVKAPAAARHFRPGQFFRLHNYETIARRAGSTPLLMEGVALTGASVDTDRGLLSLIALELGVSTRLIAHMTRGEPVVVMGPTGAPTEIPEGQQVILAGGGLGNAVLFSIAKALRQRGNAVLYFAGYRDGRDLFKREEIEPATDQVIWSTDIGTAIQPARPQDAHVRGTIVDAMVAYAAGRAGERLVPFETVDRIIAIGSDRMMAAVRAARHGILGPYLKKPHVAIASINSPMQCMMKEVCAQCLQRHVDPDTGQETMVFSCFNQDQDMDRVDFPNLAARLRQNTVQEKLSNLWLTHLLTGHALPHV